MFLPILWVFFLPSFGLHLIHGTMFKLYIHYVRILHFQEFRYFWLFCLTQAPVAINIQEPTRGSLFIYFCWTGAGNASKYNIHRSITSHLFSTTQNIFFSNSCHMVIVRMVILATSFLLLLLLLPIISSENISVFSPYIA